jgi:hypothetical protein
MNTSEETSTDSESRTQTQKVQDSGSSSIQEPRLSEHGTREVTSLPTKQAQASELELLQLSDHGKVRTSREFNGIQVPVETFATTEESALMYTEDQTLSIDM